MSSTTSGILIAGVLTMVGGSYPTSLGLWYIDDVERLRNMLLEQLIGWNMRFTFQ